MTWFLEMFVFVIFFGVVGPWIFEARMRPRQPREGREGAASSGPLPLHNERG